MSRADEDRAIAQFRQDLRDSAARSAAFHERRAAELRRELEMSHQRQMASLDAEIMRLQYNAMIMQAMMIRASEVSPPPMIGEVKELDHARVH